MKAPISKIFFDSHPWARGMVLLPLFLNACSPQVGSNFGTLASSSLSTNLNAQTPDHLVILAGQSQTQTVNTALSQAPQVQVVDTNGNPILTGNIHVHFTPSQGTAGTSLTTTDTVLGAASSSWTLSTSAGSHQLQVTADEIPNSNPGGSLSPLVFNASATADLPTNLITPETASKLPFFKPFK